MEARKLVYPDEVVEMSFSCGPRLGADHQFELICSCIVWFN